MGRFIKRFISILITIMIFSWFFNDTIHFNAEPEPIEYINTIEELKNAIISRQEIIFVDSITLDKPETIVLNDSVTIIGRKNTKIKNLHFQIYGSQNFEDKISISLENIVFDGCFDKSEYDIYQEKEMTEIINSEKLDSFLWTDFRDNGYYDISLSKCEFTRFASPIGAVIYLPTNGSSNGDKIISINDCKFYDNVGEERIIDIFDSSIKLGIKNVVMYDNYVVSKAANFANIDVKINGLKVYDNHFIPWSSADYMSKLNDRNMVRGGGVYFGNCSGVVENMLIENNETYIGGGMFLALSFAGKRLSFVDCIFKNNKAKLSGGAIGVESYVGYPVYFTNCKFVDNYAPEGGSICAKPFIGDRADGNTSLIEFSFCDFSGNASNDNKSFGYYYEGFTKTKRDGKIELKACRIEDETFLVGNGEKENNYNIVSLSSLKDENKIEVPYEEYSLWSNGYYKNHSGVKYVGYIPKIAVLNTTSNSKISVVQPILYGICSFFSIVIALIYIFKSKEKHIEMIAISISVVVINIGYLLLSLSKNITSALLFNNLAYLGNAFLPLFFMIAVANVCRYKIKKPNKIILFVITVISFLFTLTCWFSKLFYIDPHFAIIDGAVDIVKENGILHTVYIIYVLAYFLIIFGIVINSLINNKLKHKRYAILVFTSELVCLIIWIFEMIFKINYEFLSIAFMLTSILLAVLFFIMEKQGVFVSLSEVINEENTQSEALNSLKNESKVSSELVIKACNVLVQKKILSKREMEILVLIIQDNNQSRIAEILYISKNTVKYHTKNIYSKLSVRSKEELRLRIFNEIKHLDE